MYPTREQHPSSDGHVSPDPQRLIKPRYFPDPASKSPFADTLHLVSHGEMEAERS